MKTFITLLIFLTVVPTIWIGMALAFEYSFYGDDLRKLKKMAGDRTFKAFGRAWYAYYYPHTRFKTGTTSKSDVANMYVKWQVYKMIDASHQPKIYFAPEVDEDNNAKFEVKKI